GSRATRDGSPARVPGMDVREYPVPQPEQSAVIEIPPTGLAGRDGPAALGLQSLGLGREPVEGVGPQSRPPVPSPKPSTHARSASAAARSRASWASSYQ